MRLPSDQHTQFRELRLTPFVSACAQHWGKLMGSVINGGTRQTTPEPTNHLHTTMTFRHTLASCSVVSVGPGDRRVAGLILSQGHRFDSRSRTRTSVAGAPATVGAHAGGNQLCVSFTLMFCFFHSPLPTSLLLSLDINGGKSSGEDEQKERQTDRQLESVHLLMEVTAPPTKHTYPPKKGRKTELNQMKPLMLMTAVCTYSMLNDTCAVRQPNPPSGKVGGKANSFFHKAVRRKTTGGGCRVTHTSQAHCVGLA